MALFLVLALLVVFLLEATNTVNLFGGKSQVGTIPTESPNKTAEKKEASEKKTTPEEVSEKPSGTTTAKRPVAATNTQNADLKTPSGTFVSNHRPKLGGSKNETSEQSTCNTTPGATCFIRFTNGSIEKTLEAKTADVNGAVVWSWNIDDSGLSSGKWKVEAVANLGENTKVAADLIELEVQ